MIREVETYFFQELHNPDHPRIWRNSVLRHIELGGNLMHVQDDLCAHPFRYGGSEYQEVRERVYIDGGIAPEGH